MVLGWWRKRDKHPLLGFLLVTEEGAIPSPFYLWPLEGEAPGSGVLKPAALLLSSPILGPEELAGR